MKVKNYEYVEPDIQKEITQERKEELIRKMKGKIKEKKNRKHIAHYEILDIGKDEIEWSFMTEWLWDNDYEIRGTSPEMSGEVPNFKHILRDGKDKELPQVLSNEEITELFKIMETGTPQMAKKAREKIINHNLRLANLIVQWPKAIKMNIDVEDKKAYAYVGLINAVDHFDYKKGYKFSTYASIAMMHALERYYLKDILPYKANQGLINSIEDIKVVEEEFMAVNGKKPSDKEISEVTGYSIDRVHKLREIILRNEHLESLEKLEAEKHDKEKIISSFDDSVAPRVELRDRNIRGMEKNIPEEEAYIVDGVYYEPDDKDFESIKNYDNEYLLPEEVEKVDSFKEQIDKVLSTLTEREEMVIRLRFGLIDGKCASLEDVGQFFQVTRERVRQIEAKALRKLRHPNRSQRLKSYLDMDEQQDDGIIQFDYGTISGGIKKDFVFPELEYIQKQADFLKYIGVDLPEEVEPKKDEKEEIEIKKVEPKEVEKIDEELEENETEEVEIEDDVLEEVKKDDGEKEENRIFDLKTATNIELKDELRKLINEIADLRAVLEDKKTTREEKYRVSKILKEKYDKMGEINDELDRRK